MSNNTSKLKSRRRFGKLAIAAAFGSFVLPPIVSREIPLGSLTKIYVSPTDIIEVVPPHTLDVANNVSRDIYYSSSNFIALANVESLEIDISARAAATHLNEMGITPSFGSFLSLSDVPSGCLNNFKTAEPELRKNAKLLQSAKRSRYDISITAAATIKITGSTRDVNGRSAVAIQYGNRPLVSVGNIESGVLSGAASLTAKLYNDPSPADRARLATPTAAEIGNVSPDGIPFDVFATASGLHVAHYKKPKGDFDGFIAFLREKEYLGTVPIIYTS